jgi:iron complex transport system substrate-binding protein
MNTVLDRATTLPAEWTPAEWEALVAALTRRRLIGSGLALGLLAACGTTAPPTATVPATRMIETAKGPVQIPTNPQRVVCTDSFSPRALLDLGVTPLGVPDLPASFVLPEYAATWPTIAKTGTPVQPDLEKIAAQRPDLILGTSLVANADYGKLSEIAPTAWFNFGPTGHNWAQLAESFADALGRTSQLAGIQQHYHARADALRTTYSATLGQTRWAVVSAGSPQWWLYAPTSSHGAVLAAAGVQFTPAATGQTGYLATLSYEQIGQLADADIIVVASDNAGNYDANTQALLAQPVWQGLQAARAGRVFPLPRFSPATYKYAEALLDEVEIILKKLQGGR